MTLFVVITILLGFLQSLPSSKPTTEQVMELEQHYVSALIKRDASVFDELLAEDLIHVGFEGQIADKKEYMNFFKQGSWQYRKYEPTNLKVKLIGDAAVVTGAVERTIVVNEREISGAFAFTHVWSRGGGRWRLASSHVTNIPAAK